MPRIPKMPLHVSSGGAVCPPWKPKTIRFVRYGCTNRPFYHIVVMNRRLEQRDQPIEQLGTFDPMENQHNEKLVSFNFERIQYWLGQGNVLVSKPIETLLGLCGFFPIHPSCYTKAWRNRRLEEEAAASAKKESEEKVAATS